MDTPDPATVSAAATNLATDPLLAMLTGALDGSAQFDPFAMLKAQLESQTNPRAAAVLRLLEQRRMQEAAALKRLQEEVEAGEREPVGAESAPHVEEDLQNVQQAVDALYAEVAVLRERSRLKPVSTKFTAASTSQPTPKRRSASR